MEVCPDFQRQTNQILEFLREGAFYSRSQLHCLTDVENLVIEQFTVKHYPDIYL